MDMLQKGEILIYQSESGDTKIVGADVSVMKKSQCTTPSSYTTCSAPTLQTIKISTLDVFKRNTAVKDTEI